MPDFGQAARGLEDIGAALGDASETVKREVDRQQKLHDATKTTEALLGFERVAGEKFRDSQTNDDPARPDYEKDFNESLVAEAEKAVAGLTDVSPEAAERLRLRLIQSRQGYADATGRLHLATVQARAKDATTAITNQLAAQAGRDPDFLSAILNEGADRFSEFKGSQTADQERDQKATMRQQVILSAVDGMMRAGRFADAKAILASDKYEDDLSPGARASALKAVDAERDRQTRLALADLKRDAKTALDFARATGEDVGGVEQRLKDIGEKEAAKDFARRRDANIEIHDTVAGLALASPAEINEWAKAHLPAETKGATSDQAREFLTRQAIFQEVAKGIVANRKALEADPVGFTMRDPDVREAFEATQETPNDPELARRAVDLSLDVQEAAGLAASDRRVLSAAQARSVVAQIEDPETGAKGQAAIINHLAEQHGSNFNIVMRDLVRGPDGMSQGRQFLVVLGDSPMAAIYARALDVGDKVLIGALPDGNEDAKAIKADVRDKLDEYTASILNADRSGLGGAIAVTEGRIKAVTTLAIALVTTRGEDIGPATERAANAILGQYEFQNGYRVPIAFDPDQVALAATDKLAKLEDLNIAPAISRNRDLGVAARREATIRGIRANSRWVTNEDETGLVLMVDTNQGVEIVRDNAGERIEVKFGEARGFEPTTPIEDTLAPGA